MEENKKADINIEERTEKLEKDEVCPGCVHKTKERSDKERRDMMNRLSFNKVLLASHIKTCVTEDIKNGKEETIDELVLILQKLMK